MVVKKKSRAAAASVSGTRRTKVLLRLGRTGEACSLLPYIQAFKHNIVGRPHKKEERETNDKPLIYTAIYTLPPFEYFASSIHWIDYRLITTHCTVGKIQSNASQPLQKCALPLESTTTHQRRHCRQERYGQQKSW